MLVLGHVIAIVVVNKGMSNHWRVEREGGHGEQQAPQIEATRRSGARDASDWSLLGFSPEFPARGSLCGSLAHGGHSPGKRCVSNPQSRWTGEHSSTGNCG